MDIWEANSQATAYTPHNCNKNGPYRCAGAECAGICDSAGCDFNSYRNGDKTFFGNSTASALDSTKPMTVVTQFITTDGTDAGDLKEIRRVYVQVRSHPSPLPLSPSATSSSPPCPIPPPSSDSPHCHGRAGRWCPTVKAPSLA
jgi:hypothetical protein